MKAFKKTILAGITSVSVLTLFIPSTFAQTEVKVGMANATLPYGYLDENGEYDGYDVQIVYAIDEKLEEYTFTFDGADFPTNLANLDSGKTQLAVIQAEVNDERKEKYIYGNVGYTIWDTFIVTDPEASDAFDSFDDLEGKKLYVTTATNQAAMAEAYLEENPGAFELVYGEYTNEQIVQGLVSGTFDATLAPKYSVDTWNLAFGENLEMGTDAVHNSSAYVLFNKDTDPALIDAVNGAMKELKEEGVLTQLSEEYLQGDYVPTLEADEAMLSDLTND